MAITHTLMMRIGQIGGNFVIAEGGLGKVSGVGLAYTLVDQQQNVGVVLATGSRVAVATEDQFAGAAGAATGAYSIVKINCAL